MTTTTSLGKRKAPLTCMAINQDTDDRPLKRTKLEFTTSEPFVLPVEIWIMVKEYIKDLMTLYNLPLVSKFFHSLFSNAKWGGVGRLVYQFEDFLDTVAVFIDRSNPKRPKEIDFCSTKYECRVYIPENVIEECKQKISTPSKWLYEELFGNSDSSSDDDQNNSDEDDSLSDSETSEGSHHTNSERLEDRSYDYPEVQFLHPKPLTPLDYEKATLQDRIRYETKLRTRLPFDVWHSELIGVPVSCYNVILY